MTNPMIERVEAALEAECLRQAQAPGSMSPFIGDRDGDHLLIDGTFDLKALARAVFEAIREPTEAMGSAFVPMARWDTEPHLGEEWYGDLKDFRQSWSDAIDAALKEE